MSQAATPMRVLIVDDESPARKRLRDLLADCRDELSLKVAGEAANGYEALQVLESTPADVALLDIRMPEMDGIELAQHLMKLPDAPTVIFITAYDAYAIQAFEVNAVDYLLKPVRRERLLGALQKARANPLRQEVLDRLVSRPRAFLSIQERGKILLIPSADIVYLKAELKYVTVRTRQREYLLEESLFRLEQEFSDRLVRVHRNCLVAKSAIDGFEKVASESGETRWTVLLKGLEEKLPVSRRQQHVIKELSKNG